MRVVEAFSGIGSQSKALSNIKVNYEVIATIEWELSAIYAYDIIHNDKPDLTKYDDMDRNDLVNLLKGYSLSSNGKEPIKTSTLSKYPLEALKRIHNSIIRSNNLVNIMDVTSKSFKEEIDLFTYSFPCQDLSLSGSWHGNTLGIDRDSNNRSSMLWQVERILEEMVEDGDALPKYLLMENVTNIMSARHIDNFMEWQDFLTAHGYYNHVYSLNSENFSIPQRRKRAFMISVYIGDNNENANVELRENLDRYFEMNSLQKFRNDEEVNIEDFLRLEYTTDKYKREAESVIPNNTRSREKIFDQNDLIYNGVRGQNFVRTITTKQDRHPNSGIIDLKGNPHISVEGRSRFRYLTPRECFMLMGFDESDFDQLMTHNFQYNVGRKFYTNEKLNKLAGNSIVVNILEEIFKQIIDIDRVYFDNRINSRYEGEENVL